MNRKKGKQLLVTIFFSGLAVLINYLISLTLTPYITNNIGTEAYGYVALAKNFAAVALIITTALDSYAARYISLEYHKNNIKKANEYFSSVIVADIVLASILLILFLFVTFNIQYVLKIDKSLLEEVKLLFFLTFVNFFIITCGNAFTAAAYIKNRLDLTGIFKCIAYLGECMTLLFLFKFFKGHVYFVGIGIIVMSSIVVFFNIYTTKKLVPELKLDYKKFSLKSVKKLMISGVWNSVNSLGNMLNSGLDLAITNMMISSLAMGQLAIAKTISTMFSTLFQVLAQPFQPWFLKSYAKNDIKGLVKEMKLAMKVSGLFSNLAFAGFVSLGISYYKLWIPTQDIKYIYIITVICILGSVAEGVVYPLYYIYTLTVKNKIPCLVTLSGGILNVILMFLLIKYTNLGLIAVVITTFIIMTCINIIFNPIYMSKCLNIRIYTFYGVIIRHILSCLIMVVVFCFLKRYIFINTWIQLIINICGLSIIGIIIHSIITMNFNEIKIVYKIVKAKIKRN